MEKNTNSKSYKIGKKVVAFGLAFSMVVGSVAALPLRKTYAASETKAEKNLGDKLIIGKPELDGNNITFYISDEQKTKDLFNTYWVKLTKIAIDDVAYPVKSNQSEDSAGFTLRDGQVTVNCKGAYEDYSKNQKHKIEMFFNDGSKSTYKDEGYVSKVSDEDKGQLSDKSSDVYKITGISKKKNWKGESLVSIAIKDIHTSFDKFKSQLKSIEVNGQELTKDQIEKLEVSMSYDLFTTDKSTIDLFKGKNTINIKFNDGSMSSYTDEGESTVEEEKPSEKPKSDKLNGQYEIKSITVKDNWNKTRKLLSIDIENIEERGNPFVKDLKSVSINGKELTKAQLSSIFYSGLNGISSDDEGISSLLKDENTFVFTFKDDSKLYYPKDSQTDKLPDNSKQDDDKKDDNTSAEAKTEEGLLSLSNTLEDGEYTLGFNALYADGREGSSMLEGFFDKNVKLVVSQGKMKITMLNTLFAFSLYDFAIENAKGWESAEKVNYGQTNSTDQYDKAEFTLNVDDLTKEHKAGVIVGHMGYNPSQKGDYNKYKKVILKFKPQLSKGWKGYASVEEEKKARALSDQLLQKKLIANGVDLNGDKVVTAEELQQFKGSINIGAIEIDGAIDKGAIYDISLLKNMGPGVTEFKSDSNKFGELPKDLFDKAVNIKKINLAGNEVTNLPKDIFKNNSKLEELYLSANKLGTLPEGIFDNLANLKVLQMENDWISNLPGNIFKKLVNLRSIGMSNNKLASLDDGIFSENKMLDTLVIRDNKLNKLPDSLGQLTELVSLDVTNNSLSELPSKVGSLSNLKNLSAGKNFLKGLPEGTWTNLAKNSGTNGAVRLDNNMISTLPIEEIRKGGKLYILDIAYNYLPTTFSYSKEDADITGIHTKSQLGYYPQRTASNLQVKAKDGVIDIGYKNDNLTILNLWHWRYDGDSYFDGKEVIQGEQEYLAYMEDLAKNGKSVLDRLSDKDWTIITKVERIRDGVEEEISSSAIKNKNDISLQVKDEDMKKGDKYRVTKELYKFTATEGQVKVTEISDTFDADANTKEVKKDQVSKEVYSLPVFLKQAASDDASMGNAALNPTAKLIKDSDGLHLVLTFKGIYIESFKATGHLTKLGVYPDLDSMKKDEGVKLSKVVSKYSENGVSYPGEVSIDLKDMSTKEIGVKIWVDAMDEIAKIQGKEDGPQPAVLVIDWSKLTLISSEKVDADKKEDTTEKDTPKDDSSKEDDSKKTEEQEKNESNTKEDSKENNSSDSTVKEVLSLENLSDLLNLEDGKYLIPLTMLKINRKDLSMANGAVEHMALLEKEDGKLFLTIDFNGMKIGNKLGYLGKLSYYKDGYTYDDNLKPIGELEEGQVIDKQSDGSSPNRVRIPLVESALKDGTGLVAVHVFVPVMEEIGLAAGNSGMGQQDVLLKLDYKNVEKYTGTVVGHEDGQDGDSNSDSNESKLGGLKGLNNLKKAPLTGDQGKTYIVLIAAFAALLFIKLRREAKYRG